MKGGIPHATRSDSVCLWARLRLAALDERFTVCCVVCLGCVGAPERAQGANFTTAAEGASILTLNLRSQGPIQAQPSANTILASKSFTLGLQDACGSNVDFQTSRFGVPFEGKRASRKDEKHFWPSARDPPKHKATATFHLLTKHRI